MKDTIFNDLHQLTFLGTGYFPTTPEAQQYLSDNSGTEIKEVDMCFLASNDQSMDMSQLLAIGDEVYFKREIPRDLARHKAYMGLLGYVWNLLPSNFQYLVSKNFFYKWLKQFKGDYEIKYRFRNPAKKEELKTWLLENKKSFRITKKTIEKIAEYCSKDSLIEYKSISFDRMDETEFKDYVKNQMPYLYSVIDQLHNEDQAKKIKEDIDENWHKFFAKLDKNE